MLDPTTLSSLKVTELKVELKKRGLPVGGLKQALVDRLADDIIKEQERQNAPETPNEPVPVEVPVQHANGRATRDAESATAETLAPQVQIEVQVQERAKSPTPVPEPGSVQRAEPKTRQPSPEAVPAREPSPQPVPVQEQQAEAKREEPQQESVPQSQDIPRTEAVKEQLEIAATVAKPEQQDVQPGEKEQNELPSENKELELPTGEMQIDTVAEKTLEEAIPTHTEPTKFPERAVDEDAPMPDAPVPTEAPRLVPPTETQSSMAIAQEMTTAITSQTDLPVPVAAAEPMDTCEDSSAELRKRKRRSGSPPPPADINEEAVPVSEEMPKPAVEEEECSVSKRPRQTSPPPKPRQRDARFKGLFNNGDSLPHAESDLADEKTRRGSNANGEDDELPVHPSIHPATRALYIRNLIRPIHDMLLRQHLTALAAGPSGGSEQIELFFVDGIKTHALIVFSSLTAATRVRVGIHGKVWPNDKTRKPLWVDFVPEEKVQGWVDTEKKGGRWEVAFKEDESVEGGIRTELEEVDASSGGRIARGGRGAKLAGVPTGPRVDRERKNSVLAVQKPAPNSAPTSDAATPVVRQPRVVDLDELFKSTRTKPKLYYMPVSDEIARERLAGQRRDSRGRH